MILSVSHLISVARGHALKGGATGAVQGTVTDDVGNKFYVSYSVNVIPGPGTNLFSSTTAMQKGVASLFYPTSPRSEKEGNVVLPTQDLGVDPATGKTLCSVDVELRHRVDNSLDLDVTNRWCSHAGYVCRPVAPTDGTHQPQDHGCSPQRTCQRYRVHGRNGGVRYVSSRGKSAARSPESGNV